MTLEKSNFKNIVSEIKFYFYLNIHRISFIFFIIFFILNIIFWSKTKEIKPQYYIVPEPPSEALVSVLAFGDNEFLHRILATRLQNSGDIFAENKALKDFDYKKIYYWLNILENLNKDSIFAPSMASYIYAQTQKIEDLNYIVGYLEERARRNIDKNWWWAFQAMLIAKNELKNLDKAIELAKLMSENKDEKAPLWTKEMVAFLYKIKGDDCLAFKIISNLIDDYKKKEHNLLLNKDKDSLQEYKNKLNFMNFFIQERIKKLQEKHFNPNNCINA